MTDELSARLADLLDGTYDCVDRIVLNGYHSVCYSAGGFRLWWRSLMGGSEEQLDNAHLMRLAGRFSRRVRGFAKAHHIPVIDCRRGDRAHRVGELRQHADQRHRLARPGPGGGDPGVPAAGHGSAHRSHPGSDRR